MYSKLIESQNNSRTRIMNEKQPGISKIWNSKYQSSLGPGKVKPLSPFKWGRPVAIGISSILLFANSSIMSTNGAYGIASAIAPIITISYLSRQNSRT